jgi:glycosyltransferase involved in cell wall biosynthesis
MACGVATVASDAGAIGAVVKDGHSALLARPDDEVSLSAALLRLVDDEDLRRRLGRAARDQADRQSWVHNARKVVAFARTVS